MKTCTAASTDFAHVVGCLHLVLKNNTRAFPARSCTRSGVFPVAVELLLQGQHRCHSVVRQMSLVEDVGVLSIWVAIAVGIEFGPGGGWRCRCRCRFKSRKACTWRSCRRSLEGSLATGATTVLSRQTHENIQHAASRKTLVVLLCAAWQLRWAGWGAVYVLF